MKIGRNEPCPCGSGNKYKHCCSSKEARETEQVTKTAIPLIFGVTLLVGVAALIMAVVKSPDASSGRVWSTQHGHWHDAKTGRATADAQPVLQPPGQPPEGKVWSTEHGHWHDAETGQAATDVSTVLQPAGETPEGKVWSDEHGHWHDAETDASPATRPVTAQPPTPPPTLPPGPAPEGKVWSTEHSHWHDAKTGQVATDASSILQPPGPVPEGKVWSTAHGHWHDAPPSSSDDVVSTESQSIDVSTGP